MPGEATAGKKEVRGLPFLMIRDLITSFLTFMSSSHSHSSPKPEASNASSAGASRYIVGGVAAIVLVVAAIVGYHRWTFLQAHEETDDAQLEVHISPVLPRVSGYVSSVLVADNQRVAAGQPLVQLDTTDLDLKVTASEAALANAEADLVTSEASVSDARASAAAAEATVATAEVKAAKAASDLARDKELEKNGAITHSQLIDTQAEADSASTQLEALRRQAEAARQAIRVAQAKVAAARTAIASRKADVDYQRLQRSYASITAPIAGVVSHKAVEQGQYVQAGQTILSIASDSDVWIIANFKETQLNRMTAGQPAEFTVDSYPGHIFHGSVQSIAGATGARFALLPPDNATGNFVKVTQRVPVKISLTDPADPQHPLRPGLSVDVTVQVAP